MDTIINVLIVEDEPLTINSIKRALKQLGILNKSWKFTITSAINCDSAYQEIIKAKNTTLYHLAIVDISIPPSSDKKILSGEDLGIELKKAFPAIKIIVITSLHNNFRLHNIFKSLDPEGFLIKNEIEYKHLLEALVSVLTQASYYSHTILKLMRLHFSNNIVLDYIDRQLLYQLSVGTKSKDLAKFIDLSKSGIERRKRRLKEIFDVENDDDRLLLIRAREQGFV